MRATTTPSCSGTASVVAMAPTRRRTYGTMQDPVKLGLLVERSTSDRIAGMAQAAGVSKAVMLEWLIDQVASDQDGLPAGWAEQHPGDEEQRPLRRTG